MGKPAKNFIDGVISVFEAIADVVLTIWQDGVVELLGEIFAVFGIDDETIVTVNKVSIPVLGDSPKSLAKTALVKTILGMSENNAGFFKNYVYHFNNHKGKISSFYNYGKSDAYIYGLPVMSIKSTDTSSIPIDEIINTDLNGVFSVLTFTSGIPDASTYLKHKMQEPPYNYIPYKNTLSKAAVNGVVYDDWSITDIAPVTSFTMNGYFVSDYDVAVSRMSHYTNITLSVSEAFVNAGGTVDVIVTINRAVPFGNTLRVNLTYSGAAEVDFNAPSYVDILSEDVSAKITINNVNPSQIKRLDIEASVSPTPLYEDLSVWESGRFTSVILVPNGAVAVCPVHTSVQRGNVATIPVKLSGDVSGGLTVDWDTVDLDYFGGASDDDDFTTSSGTLSFTGTKGEIKNITVNTGGFFSFFASEPFEISFSNFSNTSIVSTNGVARITNDPTPFPYANKKTITEYIRFNYLEPVGKHLIVTYHESSSPSSEWYYWLYDVNNKTIPNTEPETIENTDLDMLPIAILRKNKQSINVDKNPAQQFYEDFGVNTPAYKTTRNLLMRLGLRIDDVIEAVEASPDISLVDDVYVNFAIDPSDKNKVLSKLLWLHMYEIIKVMNIVSSNGKYSATFKEQDVNNALAWQHHSYVENISIFSTLFFANPEFTFTDFENIKIGEYHHFASSNGNLWILKKVSDYSVDQITITGLSGMNAIAYDGYHNATFNRVGTSGFTIPVSHYIVKKLRGNEVIEVFPYLFRLDIFAIEITKLDWYETPEFVLFFQVVMYILSAYTLGTSSSIISVLGNALAQYAIAQIVVYIAELTGNAELAAIIGIIATVYLGTQAGMTFDFSTAEGLTNVVTTFSSNMGAAQSGELKQFQEDLENLMEDFEKQKEYQEKNKYSSNAIGGAEYWSLKSSDTYLYEAGEIQFNFDLLFDYDNIISNFYDQQLTVSPK